PSSVHHRSSRGDRTQTGPWPPPSARGGGSELAGATRGIAPANPMSRAGRDGRGRSAFIVPTKRANGGLPGARPGKGGALAKTVGGKHGGNIGSHYRVNATTADRGACPAPSPIFPGGRGGRAQDTRRGAATPTGQVAQRGGLGGGAHDASRHRLPPGR